ncbi:glycosyltransferase family 32 protein [Sporormia fimetaria CBS 119925]|uniref:Glycosyltransferase family 32 protein n=1 Tax=Sporormia fimetaria CBS 119925 TaxID=1340428 RepID=A0A6A6V5N8_9PLEO|nr:glycosyltransferase family 32 protein [Sporormia fimetaria CBS 119925]
MKSPLQSPISSHFRGRLPTQVRRVLPIYLLLAILILLITHTHFLTAPIRYASHYKRERRYQTPLIPIEPVIPRKIWQTWKTGPLTMDARDVDVAKTWVSKNPDYRYEVLTDANAEAYVSWHYGVHGFNRPDIVQLYKELNITIVKADLLRYLVIYAEGGVYADIDVECLRPVNRFIPTERYREEDVDMIIGIEIDEPEYREHPVLGGKCMSFCQWTFAAKPQLPVLLRLIENIQEWVHDMARRKGVKLSELELDFNEVISGTGPSAFTQAVLDQMNAQTRGRSKIEWEDFHGLVESKLVAGILVLNVEAFAAGQGHSDSGNHDSRGALIKHHYHASGWPSRHHRVNHPMYGEVEKCNWKRECVDQWDKNVAEWEQLPKEEQERRLNERPLLEKAEKVKKYGEAT